MQKGVVRCQSISKVRVQSEEDAEETAETSPDNFLDAVQIALRRVRNALLLCGDFDGAAIRLEALLQCLLWVEPVFSQSSTFLLC